MLMVQNILIYQHSIFYVGETSCSIFQRGSEPQTIKQSHDRTEKQGARWGGAKVILRIWQDR